MNRRLTFTGLAIAAVSLLVFFPLITPMQDGFTPPACKLTLTLAPERVCVGDPISGTAEVTGGSVQDPEITVTLPDGSTITGTTKVDFTFTTRFADVGMVTFRAEAPSCPPAVEKEGTVVKVTQVTADKEEECLPDAQFIFTAETEPSGNEDLVTWEGGGNPPTGAGNPFTTIYNTDGTKVVTAKCGLSSAQKSVAVIDDFTVIAMPKVACLKEEITFEAKACQGTNIVSVNDTEWEVIRGKDKVYPKTFPSGPSITLRGFESSDADDDIVVRGTSPSLGKSDTESATVVEVINLTVDPAGQTLEGIPNIFCIGEDGETVPITFTAETKPVGHGELMEWELEGTGSTNALPDNGLEWTTTFTEEGTKTVTVNCGMFSERSVTIQVIDDYTIVPDLAVVCVGQTQRFFAFGCDSEGQISGVDSDWSLSPAGFGTLIGDTQDVDHVDYQADNVTPAGQKVTLEGTSTEDNSKTDTAEIRNADVTAVTATQGGRSAGTGGTLVVCLNSEVVVLEAEIEPPDVIPPGFQWTISSNGGAAQPFSNFLVELFAPQTPGVFTFTAQCCPACPGKSVTVVVLQIDIEVAGVTEDDEEDPGAIICANNDDDNNSGTEDRQENPVNGEDDLVLATVTLNPPVTIGTVTISVPPAPGYALWTTPTKTQAFSVSGTFPAASFPLQFYVEGVSSGSTTPLTAIYDGICTDLAQVHVIGVDLEIFRGDSVAGAPNHGALVPDADEEDVGSFTLANLNDTNGDGTPDKDQNPVIANGALGRNELDLMRLILEKPSRDLGGNTELEIVSGSVSIWSDHTKTDKITDRAFPLADYVTDHDGDGNNDLEFWVEVLVPSESLRDIELQYKYRPVGRPELECGDTVKATGVWARATKVISERLNPGQVAGAVSNRTEWITQSDGTIGRIAAFGGTGVNPPARRNANVILIEFRITPKDIVSVPVSYPSNAAIRARPLFDVTRQADGLVALWISPKGPPQIPQVFELGGAHYGHFPEKVNLDNERPNDDPPDIGFDETDEPSDSGYMWSEDVPGIGSPALPAGIRLVVFRVNFREYIRVRFDAVDPSTAGFAVSGSRGSEYLDWFTQTTKGDADQPNAIGEGHLTFADEPLVTTAPGLVRGSTQFGVRHDAIHAGLVVIKSPSGIGESRDILLVEGDPFFDDTLDTQGTPITKVPVTAPVRGRMLAGDIAPYTGRGFFASRFSGEIVGPSGKGGEVETMLAHEIKNDSTNSKPVTAKGAEFTPPDPVFAAPALGRITRANLQDQRTEADANGIGMQEVTLLLIDDDGAADDTLQEIKVDVARGMMDEGGAVVGAIKCALMNEFDTEGKIASNIGGTIIGPNSSSGEEVAEIAVEIEVFGANPQSGNVTANGVKYEPPAPTIIGMTPIPIGGTVTVSMNQVYIPATGSAGNEVFEVRVIDADSTGDDLLHRIGGVTIPRVNAGDPSAFPDALIGPAIPAVLGTLTNPAPGGEVRGPDGSSGENPADIAYEIGSSSTNSDEVKVRAR